ncbi:Hypothetical protein NTJ_04021 [Nesidiocoris tenuis]|uniref:Uncharacterized protein n=1 Tax=Nesidiocoris tenuis TaxID=355587 RepID=A0ABN7AG22_9HEMI|nr:Hypothetical protein NTJ_04021 [Nesidiocoris tenuis]
MGSPNFMLTYLLFGESCRRQSWTDVVECREHNRLVYRTSDLSSTGITNMNNEERIPPSFDGSHRTGGCRTKLREPEWTRHRAPGGGATRSHSGGGGDCQGLSLIRPCGSWQSLNLVSVAQVSQSFPVFLSESEEHGDQWYHEQNIEKGRIN